VCNEGSRSCGGQASGRVSVCGSFFYDHLPVGWVSLRLSQPEGRKERCRPVPFVLMRKAGQCPALREAKVTVRTLQGLNARFLIHRDNESPFGRGKVQTDDVGSFGGEFGVCRDTP